MGQSRRLIAALVLTALAVAPATGAGDAWIHVRTPHLTIVSSVGEAATREVAQRLERFVDAFASIAGIGAQTDPDVPVTVMVFRNRAAFAPFKPRQNGRTLNLSGYFRRGDDQQNLIALSLERSGGDHPDGVIFHEYAHALTSRAAALWPLWLQEGLAEFSSTFEADDRRVDLGQPLRNHLRLLRADRWLPLRTVFAVDRTSPLYNEEAQNIYYAQSWALVHYLMVGEGGRRRAPLTRFIEGLAAGAPANRAFAEAFGAGSESTLEGDLRRYVNDGRYDGELLTMRRPAPPVTSSIRPVNAAEADVFQANLLLRVGRRDEAEPYLVRAKAADPKTPRLDESLGFLAVQQGRTDDALAHLRRAIAQEPANHLAHYYYAEALRRPAMDLGRSLQPHTAREMMAPLRAAIALAPSFARGYYLLGSAHYVADQDLDEGARHLRTAMRLAPPYRQAMLILSWIQLKQRDFAAAKATAQAIIDAPDANDRLKSEARLVADLAGGSQTPALVDAPSPAGPGSLAPNLSSSADGRVFLTWLERVETGGHRLKFATLDAGGSWSPARTIATGTGWFASNVDPPSIVALRDGTLAAQWLANHPAGTEAADIQIAFSKDQGATWSAPVVPHRDRTRQQHGFVSMVPVGNQLHLIWLDGRNTQGEGRGDMALMQTTVSATGTLGPETAVDTRACECCQTSAVAAGDSILAVYRDRSDQEVRDISLVRFANGRWSAPAPISRDGWTINGCPVNGPSITASGRHAAVGWFTAAQSQPRVYAVLSTDGGATFGQRIQVDDGAPLGRVDVMSLPTGGTVVSWIERVDQRLQVRVRRIDANGALRPSITVSGPGVVATNALPRIERFGNRAVISWMEAGAQGRLRTAIVSVN